MILPQRATAVNYQCIFCAIEKENPVKACNKSKPVVLLILPNLLAISIKLAITACKTEFKSKLPLTHFKTIFVQ